MNKFKKLIIIIAIFYIILFSIDIIVTPPTYGHAINYRVKARNYDDNTSASITIIASPRFDEIVIITYDNHIIKSKKEGKLFIHTFDIELDNPPVIISAQINVTFISSHTSTTYNLFIQTVFNGSYLDYELKGEYITADPPSGTLFQQYLHDLKRSFLLTSILVFFVSSITFVILIETGEHQELTEEENNSIGEK